MRAIKFRGKRLNDCEWVCGEGIRVVNDQAFVISDNPFGYEVQYNTIGQFTGFIRKDKDGHDVEVYEGDIVHVYGGSINYDYYSVVRWDEHGGCWYLRDELNLFVSFGLLNKEFITVIGNIYDNPEPIER